MIGVASRDRLLIVRCGDVNPARRVIWGESDERFRAVLDLPVALTPVWCAHRDGPVPLPMGWGGVIIGGSAAMVADAHPWMARLSDWLRDLLATDTPLLAVCFGHQVLAAAHGARVTSLAEGPEYGRVRLTPHPAWNEDELTGGIPEPLFALEQHHQAVMDLPRGTTCLAIGPRDPHHVLRYRDRAWSVQFHPESVPGVTRYCIEDQTAALGASGQDPATLLAAVEGPHLGPALLGRFRGIALDH